MSTLCRLGWTLQAMSTASATALPPSYRLALATSRPVSWQMSV